MIRGKEYFGLDRKVIASGSAEIRVNLEIVWMQGSSEDFPKLKDLASFWESAKPTDKVVLTIMNGLWDADWTLQSDGQWLKTRSGLGYA